MKHLILIIFILFTSIGNCIENEKAVDIMSRAQEQMRIDGIEAVSRLLIINPKGKIRERKIAMVSRLFDNGDTEKRLIRFLAPADVKGTGMLTYDYIDKDDDIWLYLPSLRKTRRIYSSEKAGNFMGSEFTYGDMTIFSLNEFNFRHQPAEIVNGTECYVIEQTPINSDIEEGYGFAKKIVYIGKDNNVIRKAVYYDLDGDLWKELIAEDIRLVDEEKNKYRIFRMLITNMQNNRKSEMIIDQLQMNSNIKDEYFTSRYLERN